MLPLGELPDKQTVRQVAKRFDLPVAEKPDSQDGCFLPEGGLPEFLQQHAPQAMREGEIVDMAGNVLGYHKGYGCFTVGQRKGLRVAAAQPLYVCSIDAESGRVVLGPREALATSGLCAINAAWHVDMPKTFEALVQVRYNSPPVAAIVERGGDGFTVCFGQPHGPVAPGQAAVIYDNEDRIIGGGWIDKTDGYRAVGCRL